MTTVARKATIRDREAEAQAEMAATRVAAPTALVLVGVFLLAIVSGPLCELFAPAGTGREAARARRAARPITDTNAPVRDRLAAITTAVDRDGAAARLLRPALQLALVHALRFGNGSVIVGSDGWLFLQDSVAHSVGPDVLAPPQQPPPADGGALIVARPTAPVDPLRGMLELDRQLRERDIRLVFFPVPEKEQIYPERLRAGAWMAPATNASFGDLVNSLRREGVLVFDVSEPLFREARSAPDLFLDSDTHWTPRGMDFAARGLAEFLRENLGPLPGPAAGLRRRPVELTRPSDLGRQLGLGRRMLEFFPRRMLAVPGVYESDGQPFMAAHTTAPIVVLGDSFSLVYDVDEASRGNTGFAAQLAFHLDRPVALRAAVNPNTLGHRTQWLSREPELLARARVVVYEVAARRLSRPAAWKPAPLAR